MFRTVIPVRRASSSIVIDAFPAPTPSLLTFPSVSSVTRAMVLLAMFHQTMLH